MATIKSQLSLNDGMSAVLKKITSALDTTLASFEQVQRASGSAMDVANIEAARAELAEAGHLVDELADSYRRAAQEEERLNESIRLGTSAADGMLKKVVSLAGAYVSMSAIKGFAVDSMESADTQINAQVQLRTVLENMGAMDSYEALASSLNGNAFETELVIQADNSEALSAYDAIVDKAAEIQGAGIYGDEAMIAGAAEFATYFEDANAIMSMMDTLTDYAMGMSGGGALDVESMVDYATGLGKIMSGSYDAMTKKGFAFTDTQKAIIEGTATEAQIVAELGAEYLNMSSDMQAAAAINNVIAEGWGGLYEAMSNTPEGKLIQLNNILGDIEENVGAGIYPAVVNLVNTVQSNTPRIESLAMGVATVLGFIITMLTGMIEGALAFGTAVSDNWSWIGPIVWGAAAALGAYGAVLLAVNGAQMVHNALETVSNSLKTVAAARSAMRAGASLAEAAAIKTAEGAQLGLNAALLASPITWVILSIIALIAVIYAAVGAVNHFAGTSVSATGIITGALAVLGAAVLNNTVIPLYNGIATFANFLGNVFNNPVAAIEVSFYDMCLTVSGYILNLARSIENLLNKIPGVSVDITSGLDSFYRGLETAQQAVKDESGWVDYVERLDFIDYGGAASAGYAFGQGVEDRIGGFFDSLGYTPGTIDDFINGAIGNSFAMDNLDSDVGDIADSTGSMARSMDLSGEELKYLRDIAEREAINRFTTAEVKIDMTGMTNKIDGGADLDGVIRELTDGFTEALLTAAEGVHP